MHLRDPAYFLGRVRSDFKQTNSIVGNIIRLTIANNALVRPPRPPTNPPQVPLTSATVQTAVTAVISGILFVADKTSAWHVFFGLGLIRFYSISFLSSREFSSLAWASFTLTRTSSS